MNWQARLAGLVEMTCGVRRLVREAIRQLLHYPSVERSRCGRSGLIYKSEECAIINRHTDRLAWISARSKEVQELQSFDLPYEISSERCAFISSVGTRAG
jgi:hypothetical protein